MRVLVTGATGFIGGHLLSALADRGDEILAVIRPGVDPPASVEPVIADLATSGWDLPAADAVVHLAQAEVDSSDRAGEMYAVNALAALQLLRRAIETDASRFVLASSGSVYGFGARPFVEDDPLAAADFYSHTKIHAERFAQLGGGRIGVTILRPFQPYGPGLPQRRLVAAVAGRVRRGDPVTVTADGGPVISPVHVSDLVDAVLRSLDDHEDRTLNAAGPRCLSVRDLAETAGDVFDRPPVFDVVAGESPGWVAGNAAAFTGFLGRQPTGLEAGLATLEPAVRNP